MSTTGWERKALTLIELLVVIGIIGALAGLLILLGPGLLKNERASRGAAMVQGDLHMTRSRALREQAGVGIRLFRASVNPQDPEYRVARSYQIITQATNYQKGRVKAEPGKTEWVVFDGPSLTGGHQDQSLWSVRPGDMLQVEGYQATRIIGVYPADNSVECNAPNVPGNPVTVGIDTTDYRVFRAARPVPGEQVRELPAGVVIDLDRQGLTELVPDDTTFNLDVVFSPQGTLHSPRNSRVVLWVREEGAPADSDRQSLLVVWPTGSVVSVPVDVSGSTAAERKRLVNDPQNHQGL